MGPLVRGCLAGLVAALSVGCGGGSASVSGSVSYEGKPVANGFISFTPADGRGSIVAGPISNGQYSIASVPPGPKVVKIEAADKAGPSIQSSAQMEKMSQEMKGKVGPSGIISSDIVPADATGNNITVDLKPGSNSFNFPLTKPVPR